MSHEDFIHFLSIVGRAKRKANLFRCHDLYRRPSQNKLHSVDSQKNSAIVQDRTKRIHFMHLSSKPALYLVAFAGGASIQCGGIKIGQAAAQTITEIDVLALYSQRAMCAHAQADDPLTCAPSDQNRRAIETEIILNTQLTNAAFALSGIDARLNLWDVRMDSQVYDDEEKMDDILQSLVGRKNDLGFSDTQGPDIVAYLVDTHYKHRYGPDRFNSVYDPNEGFFVITRDAKHQYEWVHNIGHLLGLKHANAFCYSDTSIPLSDPNVVTNDKGVPCFKTLMGDTNCAPCSDGTPADYVPRILLFSSPNRYSNSMIVNPSGGLSSVSVIQDSQLAQSVSQRRDNPEGVTWTGAPDLSTIYQTNKIKMVALYRNDAMCRVAGLSEGCPNTGANRAAIEAEVMINVHLTNAAFVFSKVEAYVELVWMGLED